MVYQVLAPSGHSPLSAHRSVAFTLLNLILSLSILFIWRWQQPATMKKRNMKPNAQQVQQITAHCENCSTEMRGKNGKMQSWKLYFAASGSCHNFNFNFNSNCNFSSPAPTLVPFLVASLLEDILIKNALLLAPREHGEWGMRYEEWGMGIGPMLLTKIRPPFISYAWI